jgi:hypothetical protein
MNLLSRQFLARIDARFRRSRPGSVLIIVIVLLLLLAILGAAYISTTRSARVASAQNVLSSDVDSALTGLSKIFEGVIVDDLNDTFGDLHGNTAYIANTTVVNRSFYQGQAGAAPPIAPNVPAAPGGYNPGDIVNDAINPSVFYNAPQGGGAIVSGVAIGAPAAVTAGWQPMNGRLPITAAGSDPWLADRIPDPAGTGNPLWRYITQSIQVQPPVGAVPAALVPMSILGTPFEDPTYPATTVAPASPRNPGAANGTVLTTLLSTPLVGGTGAAPTPLSPTFLTLSNGYNVPALTYNNTAAGTFVAGDADGDGIADSLLFRIPGLSLDGLTWFAGVRIIDNNSAINANTAWSRDQDYIYGNPPPAPPNSWNLFQTSVGLQELISIADIPGYAPGNPATVNLSKLNAYRFNDSSLSAGHPAAGYNPFDETSLPNINVPPSAFDRGVPPFNPTATNNYKDYNFISEGEAFYQQLIRRIANPGYNTFVAGAVPTGNRYQALPLSDEAALAYHFGLQNPNSLSQSVIESLLPNSLVGSGASAVAMSPYDPSQTPTWFATNFAYPTTADNLTLPMRALLVTHNPVSNYIQQVYNNNNSAAFFNSYPPAQAYASDPILPNYMLPYGSNTAAGANPHYRGQWNSTTAYNVNDIVVYPGAGTGYLGQSYTFIAVNPGGVGAGQPAPATLTNGVLTPPTVAQLANWQLQPWSSNPVKANVNTATFRELFRAFWCIMAGNPSNATPFGYFTTDDLNGIYDNSITNTQFMFRSPLRDPTANVWPKATQLDEPASINGNSTNTNAMLLRAALAAVNTLGLRDNSQNIISKTFILNNAWVLGGPGGIGLAPSATPVEVRVYSNAPQPFISEVYVNTSTAGNNPAGYVAIELYNPYPVPISMTNWKLGLLNRSATAIPNNPAYPQLQFQTLPIATLGIPGNNLVTPPTVGTPLIIPPFSYLLMENYSAPGALQVVNPVTDPNAATSRPGDTQMLPTGLWIGPAVKPPIPPSYLDLYVPFLENVIAGTTLQPGSPATAVAGGELVLLRPRRFDGTLTTYVDPANGTAAGSESFDENPTTNPNGSLADMVPVDSYDFTNLQQQLPADTTYIAWSYIRAKGSGNLFMTTYPGKYDGSLSAKGQPREAGTAVPVNSAADLMPNITPIPTWYPNPAVTGTPNPVPSPPVSEPAFGLPSSASFANSFPPVQIYNVATINTSGGGVTNNDSMHFPNSVVTPLYNPVYSPTTPSTPSVTPTGPVPKITYPPYLYPHGGFARNGDMLDIPFIGAYRIRVVNSPVPGTAALTYAPQSFLEMNSVTMDCSYAAVETGIAVQDAAQNIGRFVPMAASYSYVQQLTAATPPGALPDYYSWTRNIFNYLTVQSPTDGYLPNFDPNVTSSNYTGASTFSYPPQNTATPVPPTPALTANAAATDQTTQDNVGVEGLININTASWKVLSMLPFVPSTVANYDKIDRQIAQNIVAYRLAHGPFASIFDLNNVAGFQNGSNTPTGPVTSAPAAPTSAMGLLSPADPNFESTTPPSAAATGIGEDYQGDCLTLDRISNLVTTRSDTFTIYIVVQGWQNVGTANAQPMVTRRYAYIVDRSAVNADPTTRFLKTLTVPND